MRRRAAVLFWLRAAVFSLVMVGALAPSSASAVPERLWSLSARGPELGEGVLSLGGRVFFFAVSEHQLGLGSPIAFLPMVDVSYVRALSERADFEARLDSLMLLNFLETGLRFRLVGSDDFSLAARADLAIVQTGVFQDLRSSRCGVEPGVVASVGGESVQVSFQLDVPMFFVGADGDDRRSGWPSPGFSYLLRPAVSVEFSAVMTSSAFVQLQLNAALAHPTFVPAVSIGANF